MNTPDPFAQPEPDGPELVRAGSYWLPPLDDPTGKAVRRMRATTFAKAVSDQFALGRWQQRQLLIGLAAREDLYDLARATDTGDRKALDALIERVQEAAKGVTGDGAATGTALHAHAEQHDRTGAHTAREKWAPKLANRAEALAAHGLRVDPRYIERVVLHDRLDVVGRFDRLVMCPDGRWRVFDDKSQKRFYDWLEIGIQLAVYQGADAMWDEDARTWEPMPDIADDYAIVLHMPVTMPGADPDAVAVHHVDLAEAREALDLVDRVIRLRKRSGRWGREVEAPTGLPAANLVGAVTPEQRVAAALREAASQQALLEIAEEARRGGAWGPVLEAVAATRWPELPATSPEPNAHLPRRTPGKWGEIKGVVLVDADGWSGPVPGYDFPRPHALPITEAEFDARAERSTVAREIPSSDGPIPITETPEEQARAKHSRAVMARARENFRARQAVTADPFSQPEFETDEDRDARADSFDEDPFASAGGIDMSAFLFGERPQGQPIEPKLDGDGRDPHCPECNTDNHRCGGCGEPLEHGQYDCGAHDDERDAVDFGTGVAVAAAQERVVLDTIEAAVPTFPCADPLGCDNGTARARGERCDGCKQTAETELGWDANWGTPLASGTAVPQPTSTERLAARGLEMLNAIGWKGDGLSLDAPISETEFERRLRHSLTTWSSDEARAAAMTAHGVTETDLAAVPGYARSRVEGELKLGVGYGRPLASEAAMPTEVVAELPEQRETVPGKTLAEVRKRAERSATPRGRTRLLNDLGRKPEYERWADALREACEDVWREGERKDAELKDLGKAVGEGFREEAAETPSPEAEAFDRVLAEASPFAPPVAPEPAPVDDDSIRPAYEPSHLKTIESVEVLVRVGEKANTRMERRQVIKEVFRRNAWTDSVNRRLVLEHPRGWAPGDEEAAIRAASGPVEPAGDTPALVASRAVLLEQLADRVRNATEVAQIAALYDEFHPQGLWVDGLTVIGQERARELAEAARNS